MTSRKNHYRTTLLALLGLVLSVIGMSLLGPQRQERRSANSATNPVAGAVEASTSLQSAGSDSRSDAIPKELSGTDWSSIKQEYERHRYAAFPVAVGHQARNPGQQWLTRFDGRGFLVQPESAGWKWGLELTAYGFRGHEHAVAGKPQVHAEGQRVAYDWDANLREWFVNDPRGLEHGFTVHDRPAQIRNHQSSKINRPLSFTLAVRGGLRPVVESDGRGVRFVDVAGAAVLSYAGLHVFDAEGKTLPARFEPGAGGETFLRLAVEETGARYPLTIDPIAQQAYIKASNTEAGDGFGVAVAVSGDTVLVGAQGDASNAAGVNGDQSDNSVSGAGAAYDFVRSAGVWSQQAYLKASNPDTNDFFGITVAVSSDTVVVGAVNESSNATGVNGDQSDNNAGGAGAAYVFVRSAGVWSQQAYLKASNTGAGDFFGSSAAVSGDTVVVGAQGEASNAIGVNGDQSDNSTLAAGAAYVFVRSTGVWSQQAYLKASNTESNDFFGLTVAVSGDTAVVGAFGESSNATGVNGDQSDNSSSFSGAAYVFVRSAGAWSQQAYLKASNTESNDFFGLTVAVSGDTVLVGARSEASSASGVNGNQSDNNAPNAGAAYVFVRSAGVWSQQAYLKASNPDTDDLFGFAVAVSGDTVVVGAFRESSNATGVNGNQSDNSALGAGAAYVFVRSAGVWNQQAYLKASNTERLDFFGASVAVSGDTVVVGAFAEDSSATGVNGNQSDNSAFFSGSAYVFTGAGVTDAPGPQLTALGEANVWIGLKNSDDVGTRFDLLAEVLKNGSAIGSGQLNNVLGGSSGFNNAVLRTINLALPAPVDLGSGDTLSIRLSVRIAVGVAGHRSGTARLWFNDFEANSRFKATIDGVTSDHFLLNAFALDTTAGSGPRRTIDVFVDRLVAGNPFKPFGTWSKTF